jgi:hypothetical protein
VERAYAHAPIMLAHDRRILVVPLEERLQSRTSDLIAWAKTMLRVINQSVRDARAQLHTGHPDIRSYFSDATGATEATTTTPATATVCVILSLIVPSTNVLFLDIRQRLHSAGTRMATLSSDIRHYFYGINSATEIQRIANNTNVHELTNASTGRGLHLPPVRVELFLSTELMR